MFRGIFCKKVVNKFKHNFNVEILDYAKYNLPPIFAILISNKLATLKELQEYYTYQDALDMLDIVQVDNYNQQLYYSSKENINNG